MRAPSGQSCCAARRAPLSYESARWLPAMPKTVYSLAALRHIRLDVEGESSVCFEVGQPVKVFDYGRFECDTGLAYRSAIARGPSRIVEDRAAKSRFFDALLAKYGTGTSGRP